MAKAHFSNNIKTVKVGLAVDSTTVHTGPCRLWGLHVNSSMSAHDLEIKDGSDVLVVLPASTAAGGNFNFPRMPFNTSLVVDPNDAASGNVTVTYEPL